MLGDLLARRCASRGAPMGPSFALVVDFDGGGAFEVVDKTESPISSDGLIGVDVDGCLAEAMVVCTCASFCLSSLERAVLCGTAGAEGGGAEEDDEDEPP